MVGVIESTTIQMTDTPQERSSIELEFKVDGQFFAYGSRIL